MHVLGHEIGHVLGRHTSRQVFERNALNYSANALSLAGNVASLSGGFGILGEVTWLNWFPKMLATSITIGPATELALLAPVAGIMAHSRGLEWEADRFGHQVALVAGAKNEKIYNGWGEFLGFIEKHFPTNENFMTKLKANHPSGEKRLAKINERFEKYRDNFKIESLENRLSPLIYANYKELHLKLKPQVEDWANKISSGTKGKKNQRLKNTLTSFLLPASSCVKHSLGAGGE